ncbi:MAG: VanW family protein [Bacillota bacterium]|nr:VanW family protein [Bacillota bacterium]
MVINKKTNILIILIVILGFISGVYFNNILIGGKETPKITVSSLTERHIEDLMISFSTNFDPTQSNRVHNIKLAARTLTNYLLPPGEVFSFNRVINDTTAEKGYKAAPIIVGGELVPGIGGGICQLSSTLYNAALLANLEILERHSHQLTVPYIEPGRDATISYPYKDLAFRNNKDHSVLITADVENDILLIKLFGQPLTERVEIKTKVLDIIMPPEKYKLESELRPGEEKLIEGYPGFLVEVWKIVYRGEKKESEVKISVDRYAPYPEIIIQKQTN